MKIFNGVNFNFKQTAIYQAVKISRIFNFIRILKKLFLILFIIVFLLFLYGFILEIFSIRTNQILLGITIISLVLVISCWLKQLFFNSRLKNPKMETGIGEALARPEKYNLAKFLSFETAQAVNKSLKFTKIKKLSGLNSTILFYFLLENRKLNFVFLRALLNIKDIRDILKKHIKIDKKNFLSEYFENIILEALKIAKEKRHQKIEVGDMLIALTRHNLIFQEIINISDIKIDDIKNLVQWLEFLEQKIKNRKKFWEKESLIKRGSLAKDWVSGFTVILDRFSIDFSEIAKKEVFTKEAIGHQKKVKAVERILAHQDSCNDVLLVGESGVGKRGIIKILALKSILGQISPELNYKRIVALDIPAILAQTQNKNEAQVVLDKIFQEVVNAGNVILVINNFHNFVRTKDQPGVIDITGLLSSYLPLSQFQIIAITTYVGLYRYIEKKSTILDFFEKVEISEISQKETLMVLENLALFYEQKYKKFISFSALKKVIFLANRYIPIVPFPKKAINLLEEVMVYISPTKDKIVLPKHIEKVISEKTKIPIGETENKERELLLNLEKLIHKRIINQKEAVREISTALRRAKADVTIQKGPMGTFLFLGPTGVGKTETAKALAEIYFGAEKKMIRLDMSEFQNMTDIARLIGSIEEDGLLTNQIRENPFSIILLDETEKAHKNILNLFLQVLDEGYLTDGLGRKIDFTNAIIIATSNAGSQIILEALKQKGEWSEVKQNILDYVFEKAIFRPEFINRFDAVVIFKPLTKINLLDITELIFQKIKKNLKEKNINFIINEPLKEKIVELGYNPVFGARELKRVIQDKIENLLASALLSDQLKRGFTAEIVIKGENFVLRVEPKPKL